MEVKDNRYLGHVIKIHRIRKHVKQEQLSDGICTPSYLSRIENAQVSADEEIYRLLFKKLEIDFDRLLHNNDELDERLERIYEQLIQKEEITESLDDFFIYFDPTHSDLYIKSQLVYCRYLYMKQEMKQAESILKSFEEISEQFSARNKMLYFSNLIYFYIYKRDFQRVTELAQQKKYSQHYFYEMSDIEQGINQYNIALSFCECHQYYASVQFAKKALDLFSNIYLPTHEIHCHILLGINYNNLFLYDESIRHYKIARNIVKMLSVEQQDSFSSMILANLGYNYECQEKLALAEEHYLQAITLSDKNEVLNYINLMRLSYRNHNNSKAMDYLVKLNEYDATLSPKYDYQRKIFYLLLLEPEWSMEQINALQKEAIDYFYNHQYYMLAASYSEMFAQFYMTRHMYKKASELYKFALMIHKQLLSGGK